MIEGEMLHFTPNVSPLTSPPKVAVIGRGYWGKNLGRNYHALGPGKLISDKNETVPGQFQVQYPEVDTCVVLNEVLNRHDIQD